MTVIAIAVASLGFALQNLLIASPVAPGAPEWTTRANIVIHPGTRAVDAGIAVGDRIDYARMPADQRYGDATDGLRWPPVDEPVSYVVERSGKARVVTFRALAWYWAGWFTTRAVLLEVVDHAGFLVLVLLASALVLIRPTALAAALFLFTVAGGGPPFIYSWLPFWGYAALWVVGDVLNGLGAIGYFLLAVCLEQRGRVRWRLVWGAAVLLAVVVLPVAASDVLELVRGIRPAWAVAGWASLLARCFFSVAGLVLFLRLAASTSTPRMLRILGAVLGGVGLLMIPIWMLNWAASAHLGSWYVANFPILALSRPPLWGESPGWWLRIALNILVTLALLLAFYLIIRARVADMGPVISRVLAYVIIVLLVIALFVLADLGFGPAFRSRTLFVPFEILAAIAVGYWVSGLRDVAGCLSLACVDAWSAWAKGRTREEQDALVQSVGLAERTRRTGMIAEARAQMAFSAWRDGNDGEFERSIDALQHTLGSRGMRGIGAFARAATSGEDDLRSGPGDLPEWEARAALIKSARAKDAAQAAQLALEALASADRAGLSSLQVLASIAVAETCPERRDSSLERAHAIARDAGWPALSKSILALRANSRDVGILQGFLDVRLRKRKPAQPMFEISFFNVELCRNGTRVALLDKELELLLAVASVRAGLNDNDLIDKLWPESDGDAARNSFRVCLHRLRKSVGDARIVTRVGKGYVVHAWADVDLWRLEALISACRESGGREGAVELRTMCDAVHAGEGRRATLGEWFDRFDQLLNRKLDEAERLLDRDAARRART